ncbi:cysteine dioxygenase [Cellulomonas edaphi]|uniref:Cysteine dioxygenase family protein n=1 Tax=Cellulomonas edaphi TaxID=3053468 RepID=A0ABT7S6Q7_9CELL|nr:cysteine dioxygenase family protein [Cellulomons edaphi]MDM7831297.1 cysteine dioxygenase family protein [Cellulomons edaphi]
MSTTLTTRPAAPAAPERTLDVDELSALTRDIAAHPERWRPLVQFQTEGRWWTRLDGPAGVDVWLLTWLPSQGTELHDHGASAAAFTVVAGSLTEIRPDDGRLVPRDFATDRTQTVDPGDLHDVLNTGTEPAVSIHAYSPPLTRMTYWARTPEERLVPARTVDTDEPETDK